MSEPLVLGVDIGGTSIRALLADRDGRRLGTGRAGGGNPTAHPPATAVARVATAIRGALAGTDPHRVAGAVLGMAGAGRLNDPEIRMLFESAWHALGLRCGYRLLGDAVVGYAAGTSRPQGTILIAGTGAIAARVDQFVLAHIADGHGWLLGDDGSGFWLGHQAVRAVLAGMDRGRPPSQLSRRIVTALLGEHPTGNAAAPPQATAAWRALSTELVNHVAGKPPVALAALAPVVLECCAAGDPTARRLVDRAADLLVTSVSVVREPGEDSPIVLAGGLLTADTPLAVRVAERLATRWPAACRHRAVETAAAAAWLALPDVPGVESAALPLLHDRLVRSTAPHR